MAHVNPEFTPDEMKEMATLMIRCFGVKRKYDDVNARLELVNQEMKGILKQSEFLQSIHNELKEKLIKKYGEFDFEGVLSLIAKNINNG